MLFACWVCDENAKPRRRDNADREPLCKVEWKPVQPTKYAFECLGCMLFCRCCENATSEAHTYANHERGRESKPGMRHPAWCMHRWAARASSIFRGQEKTSQAKKRKHRKFFFSWAGKSHTSFVFRFNQETRKIERDWFERRKKKKKVCDKKNEKSGFWSVFSYKIRKIANGIFSVAGWYEENAIKVKRERERREHAKLRLRGLQCERERERYLGKVGRMETVRFAKRHHRQRKEQQRWQESTALAIELEQEEQNIMNKALGETKHHMNRKTKRSGKKSTCTSCIWSEQS